MKKIFLIFSETKNGKHYAHAETIRAGENLKNFIDRYPDAEFNLYDDFTMMQFLKTSDKKTINNALEMALEGI